MAEALLINRNDVVKFTAVSGNLDTDSFIHFVKIAQDKHIENYLGTDLLESIQTKIVAGTLTGDYLTLVNEYIKPCLIHLTLVEMLPFSSYTINNKGVFKHNSENAEVASKEEVDTLLEKERDTAQHYTNKLIDFLNFNAPSKYPEYYTSSNEDVKPDRDASFEGWVI